MDDLNNLQLHIVLVNVVVFKGEEVLVGRRSAKEAQAAGYWTIPGGKIERTEKVVNDILEETGKREVFEETGITIKNPTIVMNNTFIRSSGHHVVVIVLSADYESGEPTSTEELEEVKWIHQSEIESLHMVDNVKKYVKEAFTQRMK